MSLSRSNPLFSRNHFRIDDGIIHLAAGGETPFLRSHNEAFEEYATLKGAGLAGREQIMDAAEVARKLVSQRLGTKTEEIGFAGSVADAIAALVSSMDWRAGDAVLMARHEYPSVAIPLALRNDVKIIQAERPDVESFIAVAPRKVRVIAISHVSYVDGRRTDIPVFRRLADQLGAELWVDFTQTAGVIPFDLALTDFAVASCYKWLLGTTGVAIAYWNSERNPNWFSRSCGWAGLVDNRPFDFDKGFEIKRGAVTFTRGNPPHLPIYILNNAIRYLNAFEAYDVQNYVQALTTSFMDCLEDVGIACATPRSPLHHGASVCLFHPHAKEIVAELAQNRILVWGSHGRMRFSFHGYNTSSEIAPVVDQLRKLVQSPINVASR